VWCIVFNKALLSRRSCAVRAFFDSDPTDPNRPPRDYARRSRWASRICFSQSRRRSSGLSLGPGPDGMLLVG